MKFLRWLGKIFRDLFYGVGNQHAELARILATFSIFAMFFGEGWNVYLGLPLELGPAGFGGGLAAVIGAAAAWTYAKDRAGSENKVANAVVEATPSAPPAKSAVPKAKP
jgi:hypothetical protein